MITNLTLLTLCFFTTLYLFAYLKKDNSIVDIAWGASFVLVSTFAFFQTENFSARAIILLILVALWGIRLSTHIAIRNHGKPEDFRYRNWRETWGKTFYLRSYFQIFLLQGFLMLIIASPLYLTFAATPKPLTILDLLGLSLFLLGFLYESIGDYQLSQFKKNLNNKGKIMKTGLWSTTRHPNYFGEVTLWWGIYLIAASAGQIFTIISPLLITFLILRVSGVTMLEKKYHNNPEYQEYIKNTPAFFPRIFTKQR